MASESTTGEAALPRVVKESGTSVLTWGGVAAAFGAASCCALPLLLTSAGLGAAWLGAIARIAAPYREPLLALGAASLIGGALLLVRQQREAMTCAPGGRCAPLALRVTNMLGLLLGAGLLWAGYRYA